PLRDALPISRTIALTAFSGAPRRRIPRLAIGQATRAKQLKGHRNCAIVAAFTRRPPRVPTKIRLRAFAAVLRPRSADRVGAGRLSARSRADCRAAALAVPGA